MEEELEQWIKGLPDEEVEKVLITRIIGRIHDVEARTAIICLSVPHWFDDGVLKRLQSGDLGTDLIEGVSELEHLPLIEQWSDGSRAVIAPVRRVILDRMCSEDLSRYKRLSTTFAEIFDDIAEHGGDVFDHIESVFHRLVADPDRGAELLLADGITWKSDPLFAFDALGRLVKVAKEQRERGILSERASCVLQLLELYLPDRRKTALEEEKILTALQESTAVTGDLFQAELLLRLGLAKLILGQTNDARQVFGKSLSSFQRVPLRRGEADALRALGRTALKDDNLSEAQHSFEQALNIFQDIDLKLSATHCVKSLAETSFYQGRISPAEDLFKAALEGFNEIDGQLGEANTRVVYSQLLTARGQFEPAQEHLDRATTIYEAVDHGLGVGNCFKNKGIVLFEQERYDEARRQLGEAASLYDKWGSASGQANCKLWMAACETRQGRPEAALPLLEQAGKTFARIGDRFGQASVLREQALAHARRGEYKSAIQILQDAITGFQSAGNEIEVLATSVALGRAATEAGFPPPYTPSAVAEIAANAEQTFQAIGFHRHSREAGALSQMLGSLGVERSVTATGT
jgi:tetratricopeptide (TPR) repeat protein